MTVGVSVHPQAGAAVTRPVVRHFVAGKVTGRFEQLAEEVAKRYAKSFRDLAK